MIMKPSKLVLLAAASALALTAALASGEGDRPVALIKAELDLLDPYSADFDGRMDSLLAELADAGIQSPGELVAMN